MKLCGVCGKKEMVSTCKSCKIYVCDDCNYEIGENFSLCPRCFETNVKVKKNQDVKNMNFNLSYEDNESRIQNSSSQLKELFFKMEEKIIALPNTVPRIRKEWKNYYIRNNRKYFAGTKMQKTYILFVVKSSNLSEENKKYAMKSSYFGSNLAIKLFPKGKVPLNKKGCTDNIDYVINLINESYELIKL